MRRALSIAAVICLVMAACSDDAVTTTVTSTTAGTTTTTTTTTTMAPPPTLPQLEQDTIMAVAVWEGLSEAWQQGPSPAARYISENSYPGMPAAYEDCLAAERPQGWKEYSPDAGTLMLDPGWGPSGIDIDVEGRIYTIEVTIREGLGTTADWDTKTLHVSILEGEPYFFFSCEPTPPPTTTTTIAADALAYRLAEGATYTHKITYRSDITEDQSPAEGRTRTGRETWTQYRDFEVGASDSDGTATVWMTFSRVAWEMYSAGVHRNQFDTADDDDPDEWYGDQGDLALETLRLAVGPAGPRIDSRSSHSFLVLPAVPVAVGDTWEGRWSLNEPEMTGTMIITATAVDAGEVRVSFEGTGDGTRLVRDMIKADLDYFTEGEISGTAVIDADTGWLRSMTVDIEAAGTIEIASDGFWQAIRPLAGSSELLIGVPMPVTYEIRIETRTIDG